MTAHDRLRGTAATLAKLTNKLPVVSKIATAIQKASLDTGLLGGLEPGSQVVIDDIPYRVIPAAVFLAGTGKTQEVSVRPFLIMEYPVTWGQYLKFCEETGYPKPQSPSFAFDMDHPVVNVSWYDAKKFAEWLSKKTAGTQIAPGVEVQGADLPESLEWELAMRGTDGRRYPWGDNWDPSRCVCNTTGTKSIYCEEGEKGQSPFGVKHGSGQVWEWTNTTY